MKKLLTYKEFKLTYYTYGTGNNILVCFPGYGRLGTDYEFLSHLLPNHKIIAINYFFDSNSYYPSERIERNEISKEEYNNLVEQIIRLESVDSYNVLGYSMGGRLALVHLELTNNVVKKCHLLAPDGVYISKWHRFTSSTVGRWLYRTVVIHNPRFFFRLVHLLSQIRVIKPSMVKFLYFHLDSDSKRHSVYNNWLSSSKLIPNHDVLRKKSIQYDLFIGKYDRVITDRIHDLFRARISSVVRYNQLECGHDMMQAEVLKQITELAEIKKAD